MTDGGSAPRATRRNWVGLAVMALPLFMLSTSLSVLYLAMPAIGAALKPVGSQGLWILHIGEFLTASCVITFGLLTNRVGPKRLLLLSVGVYGVASAAAAVAGSAEALIGARAVQGIAAGGFVPAGMAMVRIIFRDENQFRVAFSIFMSAFVGGLAAGPAVGGILLEHFWWGAVFLVNVPAAPILLTAGPFLLPRDRPDRSTRIDAFSVILSVVMVMSVVYGFQEAADRGPALLPVAAMAAGLVLVTLFIRRQQRIHHPLLDPSMFQTRAFRILLVLLAVAALGFPAADMLMAQYLQVVRDLGAFHTGLLLTIPATTGTIGTLLTPALQRWLPPIRAIVLVLGTIAAAGFATFTLLPSAGLPVLAAALSVFTGAISPLMTLMSQLIVTSVPMDRTGSAVAIQEVASGLGTAGGLAAVGSLSMSIYRAKLTDEAPSSMSTGDIETASSSLGGAAALADELPGGTGPELFAAASAAFTSATQSAYLVAASIAVIVAVLVLGWLRRVS